MSTPNKKTSQRKRLYSHRIRECCIFAMLGQVMTDGYLLFLVVGLTEDNFGSLTEEQIKKFSDRFHSPEGFMRIGNQILVFPIDEPIKKESVMDKLKNQPTVPKKDPIVKKHKEEVR